jgi:TetR/AcrR family transcriptional regulator, repressor for neighboring sulfatase
VSESAEVRPGRGPDHDAEALLVAATRLFAERGPENVSIRQIAQAAGVEQDLVLHYFGSKDGLVNAVLDRSATDIRAAVVAFQQDGDFTRLVGPGSPIDRHARIIAHLVMDWRDPAALQSGFPAADLMVDRMQELIGVDEPTARRRVAQAVALVYGWRLYEPFVAAAFGRDVAGDDLSTLADAVVHLLARPDG